MYSNKAMSWTLLLLQPEPAWQLENMTAPRVMPDTVLLPDGTVFICNGGSTGTAGGTAYAGQASNANGLSQAGTPPASQRPSRQKLLSVNPKP